MEESNNPIRNISALAEVFLVALGLALLFIVPMLYNLNPPSTNPISTGTQASFSLKQP